MKTITFTNSPKSTSFAGIRGMIVLALIVTSLTVSAQSGSGGSSGSGGGGKLTFKNSKLLSGTAGNDGAVYQFPKVDKDLDANVRIVQRSSSLVYLKNIDMVTSGFDKAWQPEIGYNNGSAAGAADWWMEFEVSFVEEGSTKSATVEEFDLSAIDIDGNGHLIREYVSFYGLKSYVTESTSILAINNLTSLLAGILSQVGVRFDGPTVNFANIDTSGTSVMVTSRYEKVQKFTVRMGAVATGASGASERMYSMYFQEFKYKQPAQATLPVNLKNFDATVHNSKVDLEWSTSEEINFSHFMVQRSNDGHDFSDVTMIMSNAHALDYTYNYTESFKQNAPPVVYYRLKMVDMDGTSKFSAIRIVKLNTVNNSVAITTFPNPVTSELRITIPSDWQNKEVVYDVVNMNGNVVKHKSTQHASQTESLNVNDIKSGVYVIRLKSGSESAVQQVVKQ